MNSSDLNTIIFGVLATVFTAIGAIEGIKYIIRYFKKRFVQRQQIHRADIEAVPMMPRQEHRHQHGFQLPRTPIVVLSNVYIFGATVGTSPIEEIRMDTTAGRVEEY